MNRPIPYLPQSGLNLQDWTKEVRTYYLSLVEDVSPALANYLAKEIKKLSELPSKEIWKWRNHLLIQLSDLSDGMANPGVQNDFFPDECQRAIEPLLPKGFDYSRQCLFCLKNFSDSKEMSQHICTEDL